jgi:hypothetical protein
VDETESLFPRPLTDSEPDTEPQPSGNELTGSEKATQPPVPAEPSLGEEARTVRNRTVGNGCRSESEPPPEEPGDGGWVPV